MNTQHIHHAKPAQHRLLTLGENTKKGDEWFNSSTGVWQQVRAAGSAIYPLDLGNYRRKL